MNEAYQNMRAFWLNAKNMQSRKGTPKIGPDKILAAAVEMSVEDGSQVKRLFIATNSLGDSSLYFENNSISGLGGIIGRNDNEPLQQAAARMLAHAGKLTVQMTSLNPQEEVPSLTQPAWVCLWAISNENIFYKQLREEEVRQPENPFYPMFAYSQQMIGFFQAQQQPTAHA